MGKERGRSEASAYISMPTSTNYKSDTLSDMVCLLSCPLPAPPRGRSSDDLVRVAVESHVPPPVRVLRSSPLWPELLCAALPASPRLSPYGAARYPRPADLAGGPRTASPPRHHPAPGV